MFSYLSSYRRQARDSDSSPRRRNHVLMTAKPDTAPKATVKMSAFRLSRSLRDCQLESELSIVCSSTKCVIRTCNTGRHSQPACRAGAYLALCFVSEVTSSYSACYETQIGKGLTVSLERSALAMDNNFTTKNSINSLLDQVAFVSQRGGACRVLGTALGHVATTIALRPAVRTTDACYHG